jgi:hypothetical protein
MPEHHQRHRIGARRNGAAAIGDDRPLECANALEAAAQFGSRQKFICS